MSARINLRASPEAKAMIERAAALMGASVLRGDHAGLGRPLGRMTRTPRMGLRRSTPRATRDSYPPKR